MVTGKKDRQTDYAWAWEVCCTLETEGGSGDGHMVCGGCALRCTDTGDKLKDRSQKQVGGRHTFNCDFVRVCACVGGGEQRALVLQAAGWLNEWHCRVK